MNFNFAAAPKTTASAFSFGTPSATSAPTAVVQPSFGGAAAAPTSGFSLGATPATSKPSFGLGTPSFGAPTTSSTPSLSFGAGASVAGASTSGLGSVQPQTTGFTLGGAPTTTAAQTVGFGAPSTSVTATTTVAGLGGSLGLGGTLSTSLATNPATEVSSSSSQNIKESNIPNELLVTVEDFKKFVKEERSISSDIAHTSPKIHDKISEEINGLNQLVSALSSGLAKNCMLLDKIKLEAAQEIQNAEIAQRTKDTPPGLQYENLAPYEYFSRLVSRFETQMLHYRRQIEETEQHLHSMTTGQQLSSEDISRALQKLHTAFVALAGQYQTIHEAVLTQSEGFVQWHRSTYGSTIEVYAGSSAKTDKTFARSSIAMGPSPFGSENRDLLASAKATLTAQIPSQVPQNNPQMCQGVTVKPANNMFGQPAGIFGGTNTGLNPNASTPGLLGSTMSPFGASPGIQSTAFQTGGKRGKH